MLSIVSPVCAQQVEFKASAPAVVETGEQFRLSYTVNQSGTDLQVPDLDGFELLMGPGTSQSSYISIINGKTTQNVSFTYTYLLEGVSEGTYQIPPATITVDGKQYRSNELEIQVIKGSGNGSSSRNGEERPVQPDASAAINDENLFVKVDVSRKSLYLGESTMATIKVYSRVDLTNFGRSKFPSFTGFLSEEIPTPQQIELVRENYNGKLYNVGIISKMLLFPQHVGDLTIEPFELECIVRQRLAGGGRSIFDDFFGNYRDVRAMRRSKPVTVHVSELPPKGKPADFSGTVGTVSMSTSLSADTVNANNAVTYKVTFQGTGNLKLLRAPSVEFPLDFESYDPKESKNLRVTENGVTGTVSFEYVVIPRYSGNYKIPAVRFSYFDPGTGSYKTIVGKEYNVTVPQGSEKEGNLSSGSNTVQYFKKEDIRRVGEDIRYIKTGSLHLKKAGVRFYGTPAYLLSLFIPLVLFVMGILLARRRIRANADVARVRNRAATKMARRRLKVAFVAMKNHNAEQFFEEVLKALWGYMSYKLNIDRAELNRDNISEIMERRGVPEDRVREFIDLLDKCEYARYAPGSNRDQEMNGVYTDSIDVIARLDKAI